MNNAASASFDETVELIENMPNEEAPATGARVSGCFRVA